MDKFSSPSHLKVQRDRFIAFAFAGAEVLVEVDSNLLIRYCAGTSLNLLAIEPDGLLGRSINDFIADSDHGLFDELIHRIRRIGRMTRMQISLLRNSIPFRATVSGLLFPDYPGSVFLTLSRASGAIVSPPLEHGRPLPERLPRSGTDFAKLAEQRLNEAEQFGEDLKMTLIDLSSALLSQRMEEDAVKQFTDGVESYLCAWSVDGTSVGQIDDGKFGIIHDRSLVTDDVTARISKIAALFDPSGDTIQVKATTLDLGRENLTQEDVSKALVYTINQFVEKGGETFAITSLKESYSEAIDETLAKVNAFRQTLSSDAFTLVFQPIVDLWAWQVHHYEALSRMVQGDKLFLPARFISFAEDFGVVNEFDMMVVRKSIYALKTNDTLREAAEIAVNLSGRSLSNDSFVHQLFLTLMENRDVLPRMMFEVTESSELKDLEATNRILQKLRSLGCKISIDDFGAGSAAFQYLKALQVDYLKIDGSYILDAFSTRHGRPFLKAIAQLAIDLDIQTIGEMVEDSRTMWLLRDVGVHFAQGYYFSKPLPDVRNYTLIQQPARHPPEDRVNSPSIPRAVPQP